MHRSKFLVTMLGVLCIASMVKLATELRAGKFTSTAVVPFLLIAMVAEQITPKYAGNTGARAMLKAVRVGGFLIAVGLLLITSVIST